MSKISKGWWDELNDEYWPDVITTRFKDNLKGYEYSSPDIDYYDGVDMFVTLISTDGIQTLQLKSSKTYDTRDTITHLSLKDAQKRAKVNMSIQDTNGNCAGFATYFRGVNNKHWDDGNKNISEFVFSYPFLGFSIFVRYSAMYDLYHKLKPRNAKSGNGQNKYYQFSVNDFIKKLPKNSYGIYETSKLVYSEVMRDYD